MKILLAGWFSFDQMGATAGDILTRDLVCAWLAHAGFSYDVCLAPPFHGGVDWQSIDPECYSHVVFVCGPCGNGWPLTEFLSRFKKCRLIGLNLSMLEPLDTWNPFDLLFERDSSVTSRPDLTFVTQQKQVPIVGVVLVHPQSEYRHKDLNQAANHLIQGFIATKEISPVPIDTRLDCNSTGLRTPAEVESLIARMDVVLTTRLHGMVLALKNGIPAIAIDPIGGGAKIRRQAKTIGWPVVFTADTLTDRALQQAFDYCLTEQARSAARKCRERAVKQIEPIQDQFIAALVDQRGEIER